MVRQLPPWFENLGKRQVKVPKVYSRDSGLLHALLGVTNQSDLEHHRKSARPGKATPPTLTPFMIIAMTDLKLDELFVAYPGENRYTLAKVVGSCRWSSWKTRSEWR